MFEEVVCVIISAIVAAFSGWCMWKFIMTENMEVEVNQPLVALLAGALTAFISYYCWFVVLFVWVGYKLFMRGLVFIAECLDFVIDVYFSPKPKSKKRRRRKTCH